MKQHVKNFLQVRKATVCHNAPTSRLQPNCQSLPERFTVAVWNVFKRNGGIIFDNDILDLAERSDILCLQEVLAGSDLDMPKALGQLNYHHASSYLRPDNLYEGVLTLSSHAICDHSTPVLSLQREPITKTPKTALICQMPLSNGETLIVINIHMLLFKRKTAFTQELANVLQHCQTNRHCPAIFCGDFNTFTQAQLKLLDDTLFNEGFNRVIPAHEPRANRFLDHIYVRGLKVEMMEIIDTITSSDHYPLICQLHREQP